MFNVFVFTIYLFCLSSLKRVKYFLDLLWQWVFYDFAQNSLFWFDCWQWSTSVGHHGSVNGINSGLCTDTPLCCLCVMDHSVNCYFLDFELKIGLELLLLCLDGELLCYHSRSLKRSFQFTNTFSFARSTRKSICWIIKHSCAGDSLTYLLYYIILTSSQRLWLCFFLKQCKSNHKRKCIYCCVHLYLWWSMLLFCFDKSLSLYVFVMYMVQCCSTIFKSSSRSGLAFNFSL